jgi:hypothetical protein
MESKYTTIFSSELKCIVSEEKDLHLSIASLDSLRAFLPNIDTDKNIDLLPISTNAFVAGRVNRNGDVVDNKTAVEIAKHFVNKPINLEHNRTQVVGCILNYGFNTFGSEEPMTEEQALNSKDPFNVALGGVMWKVVNKDLANLVEESNDPTSPNYMRVSASWELGFNEYQFVLLDNDKKNIMEGRVVDTEEEMEKLKSKSKAFGGTGMLPNGQRIYRLVTGNIIPLGIGLTAAPAADVVGVATNEKKLDLAVLSLKEDNNKKEESDAKAQEQINISQNEVLTVNSNTKSNNIMKITKIEDITAESLKEIQASQVAEFIAEEIKKASETFDAERKEKEEAIKAVTEKYEAITKDSIAVKEELEKVKAALTALEEEKAAKIREEVFNTRMASFDEEYDLSDEDRQVLATDIKDLNDETFAAYKNKMTVLMKEKNKAVKKAKMAKEAEMKEKTMATETVAKVVEVKASEAKEVVNQALDNGTKQATDVPATATVNEPSLYDRYKKAFSIEGFNVS